jgi:nucleotide-binding universal stress UspA family protein
MISRILVPIDLSDASSHALDFAARLAADIGAPAMEALHVVETPYLTGADLELTPAADLHAWAEQETRAFVDRHLESRPPGGQGSGVAVHLVTGSPAREILRFLKERPDIDLVVMATHGRGRMARLMLGSVADKVVRAAACPVITIREARSS